jgi:hypothetical protein
VVSRRRDAAPAGRPRRVWPAGAAGGSHGRARTGSQTLARRAAVRQLDCVQADCLEAIVRYLRGCLGIFAAELARDGNPLEAIRRSDLQIVHKA